jgi:hypothetical protein
MTGRTSSSGEMSCVYGNVCINAVGEGTLKEVRFLLTAIEYVTTFDGIELEASSRMATWSVWRGGGKIGGAELRFYNQQAPSNLINRRQLIWQNLFPFPFSGCFDTLFEDFTENAL